jgi:hypothetical protein
VWFCSFAIKLLEDVVFFVADVLNSGQLVLHVLMSKPNRERQKLMREQNILKQVCLDKEPDQELEQELNQELDQELNQELDQDLDRDQELDQEPYQDVEQELDQEPDRDQ